jgi:hypothetical protein
MPISHKPTEDIMTTIINTITTGATTLLPFDNSRRILGAAILTAACGAASGKDKSEVIRDVASSIAIESVCNSISRGPIRTVVSHTVTAGLGTTAAIGLGTLATPVVVVGTIGFGVSKLISSFWD